MYEMDINWLKLQVKTHILLVFVCLFLLCFVLFRFKRRKSLGRKFSDLFSAEMSLERYWRGPQPQWLREEGINYT